MDFDKKLKENVKIDIKRYKSAPKQDQIIHSQNHELLRRLDFDTRAAKKKIKRIANMGGIRASKTMYNPKASTAARAEGHSRYYNIYEKSSTRSISNLPNLAEKSQLTSKSQTKKGESSSHRKKNKTSRNSPRKAKIKRRKMNSEKEPTSITKLNKSKNSVHGLRRNKTSQKHKNIEKRGKGFSHKKSTFLTSTNTIPKSNFHLTLNSFNNNNLGKNPYNGNAAHYSTNPNNRSNNWMAATQRSISKGYFSPIEDDSSFSALQFKDANINNNPFFKPKPKVQNHQAKTIMTLIREADTLYGNLGGRAGILDRPNLNNFKETMKSRKHVDQMLSKARSQTKIGSIPQIRNISFLNSSMQISKKKKTTFLNDIERGRGSLDPKMEHKSIPFLKQMTNSSVKLTLSDLPLEADKLQDILMIDNFPRLESKLFEVMKNIKLSYYQQERVRERVESLHFGEGVPSCRKDDFILKYIEGYKIKGCSDRADHLQLLKWLNLAKEKHKLNSCSSKRHSEIEDVVDYVRDKGRIIGFFAKQIIELEEQRCREAAMSTKKLYTECVDMFNSFAMFIQVAMQELDKGSHYKLDLIKLKYEDDMKELKLETKQQKEQIAELEQRIKELNRKGRVFRKRIANDFLTKKWLKADLISASEYLTILRAENKKIGYIIDDMVKDIKMINPASQMIERIGIQLSDISGLKKKYKKELVYLDHHSEVKVDEDNFKGKKRMNTREIDRIQSQLGLEFDDEEMADFVTREIGVVTDDIRDSHLKKVACCQAGPEGYADFSANVDFIDCQKCVFHLAKIRSLQARLGAVKEDKKALEKDYELLEETVQKFKIEAKKKIRRASTLKKRKKRKKKAKNLTDRGKNKGIREGLDLKFPFDLDSPRAGDNESLGSSIRVPSIIQGAIAPVGDTLGTNRSHFNTEYKNQTSVHPSGACDFGDEELSEFSQDSSYLSEGDLEWANITLEGHLNQKLNDYYKSCVVNLSSKKLLFAVSDKRYLKLSKEVSKFRKLIDNFISKRHKDEKHGKRSRKNLSSQKRLPGRRKSIRPPVENLSKKRFNDMVSLANSLFNEFLHSVKKGDGQPPEDVMVMRDKSLWKFLTHLYKEYKTGLEKGAVKTPSLVIFVFSSIRDKNSLKKNLVKKFQSLLYSVYAYRHIPSFSLFSEFIHISGSLNTECLKIYLEIAEHMSHKLNMDFLGGDAPKHMIKWKNVKDVIHHYLSKYMKESEYFHEVKEKIFEDCHMMQDRNDDPLDFDTVLSIILDKHALYMRDVVSEFYETADLNGDGEFDFEEFVRITRHVEHDFFIKQKMSGLRDIFDIYAVESGDGNEKVIDPLAFKKLCRDYKIYNIESQLKFVESVKNRGLATSVKQLVANWNFIILPKIKISLIGCKSQSVKIFADRLDGYILNFSDRIEHKIWLNYKILEQELERLNTDMHIMENYICDELKIWDKLFREDQDHY